MVPSSNDNRDKGNFLAKIRLDFRGVSQQKFFWGIKSGERAAEEMREQKAALLRNVPFQGITIEDIDLSLETYKIIDEALGHEASYAPLILTMWAVSIEDLIRFVIKDEFRKIEIIQPQEFTIGNQGLEKILFKVSQEINLHRLSLESKFVRR